MPPDTNSSSADLRGLYLTETHTHTQVIWGLSFDMNDPKTEAEGLEVGMIVFWKHPVWMERNVIEINHIPAGGDTQDEMRSRKSHN